MRLAIDDVTLEQAVALAMAHISEGKPCRVVTPNAEFALMAKRDPAFCHMINTAQLILPDGISIVLAARIIGRPIGGKVAGFDFAEALCDAMSREGKRLYILGAKQGVAEKAAENLKARYPGLVIAGTGHGYYEHEDAVVDDIARARADALFIAMGAPRSERFALEHEARLGVGVTVGVGGTVDIFAGNSRRAPGIMIRLGLEWLYRLVREPWRLGRMIKLPLYLLDAVLWRLTHKKHGE